ncbi:gluconokinase [Corynebacterium aurimucosum]|uniref:gluconokinase n=1 Tax=Corynebacterium aurimucosum TaxID=169292 RepID=UPI003990CB06
MMHKHVVIMGVSSCGKSTVGELLAQHTGLPFRDGDDMHPAANIEKMASGQALDDDDRKPWLESIGRFLADQEGGAIVGCSALKHSYRELIRAAASDTVFVHLHGTYELLKERMIKRSGHFMPVSLLDSQFETLEELRPEEAGVVLDVSATPEELAAAAAEYLRA